MGTGRHTCCRSSAQVKWDHTVQCSIAKARVSAEEVTDGVCRTPSKVRNFTRGITGNRMVTSKQLMEIEISAKGVRAKGYYQTQYPYRFVAAGSV